MTTHTGPRPRGELHSYYSSCGERRPDCNHAKTRDLQQVAQLSGVTCAASLRDDPSSTGHTEPWSVHVSVDMVGYVHMQVYTAFFAMTKVSATRQTSKQNCNSTVEPGSQGCVLLESPFASAEQGCDSEQSGQSASLGARRSANEFCKEPCHLRTLRRVHDFQHASALLHQAAANHCPI